MAYSNIAFSALLYALDALYSTKRTFLRVLEHKIERQSIGRNHSVKCFEIIEISRT